MIYVTPPTPYLAPTSLDSSTCNNGLPVVRVETVRVRGEAQKASLVVQVGGLFSSTLQHEDCSSHSGNGLPGERCPYEASAARRSLARRWLTSPTSFNRNFWVCVRVFIMADRSTLPIGLIWPQSAKPHDCTVSISRVGVIRSVDGTFGSNREATATWNDCGLAKRQSASW